MSFDAISRWQNIVAQGETELGQAYVGRTAVWGGICVINTSSPFLRMFSDAIYS